MRSTSKLSALSLAVCSAFTCCGLARAQMADDTTTTYEVVITNMTSGQPLSPPIVVSHKPTMHLWHLGEKATPELAKVAEEGMTADLVKMCQGKATDIAAGTMEQKIMPGKSLILKVKVKPGDVISVATMVAASNDAFTGLDNCPLDEEGMKMMKEKMEKDRMGKDAMGKDDMKGSMMMKDGVMTAMVMAMDAGTEENTEKKSDTAAPDMGKGHPATTPQQPISMHEGIKGTGDLDKEKLGWTGPVARIEIKKVM